MAHQPARFDKHAVAAIVALSESRDFCGTCEPTSLVYDYDLRHGATIRLTGLEKLLGYSPEELTGSLTDWWADRIHCDDRAEYLREFQSALDQSSEYRIEARATRKDGAVIHIINCAVVLRDEQGVAIRLVGSVKDVTAQKQYDSALKRSEERYRKLAEATSSFVWLLDESGASIEYVTKWEAMTGQPLSEANGAGWLIPLHPEDRDQVAQIWGECLRTKAPYDVDYRIRMRDGSYRWFHVQGFPVWNEDGTFREWIGVCVDIQERKEAEESLRLAAIREVESKQLLFLLNEELEQRVEVGLKQLTEAGAQIEFYRRMVNGPVQDLAKNSIEIASLVLALSEAVPPDVRAKLALLHSQGEKLLGLDFPSEGGLDKAA